MIRALTILAEGFEEIEAVTPIDILRRAGVQVTVAALSPGPVVGSHNISLIPDCTLNEADTDYDLLLLPGGIPGAHHLRDDSRVIKLLQLFNQQNKLIGAICAAPVALEKAGIIEARQVTSHPSKESEITSAEWSGKRLEIDQNIITAQGAGCSFEFSFALLRALNLSDEADKLQGAMICK